MEQFLKNGIKDRSTAHLSMESRSMQQCRLTLVAPEMATLLTAVVDVWLNTRKPRLQSPVPAA